MDGGAVSTHWRLRPDKRHSAKLAEGPSTVGLWGAAGSAVTGLTDFQDIDAPASRIGAAHGLLNVGAASLYLASAISRKKSARSSGRALAAIGYAIASGSAYLGGSLVYEEGVGVDRNVGQQFPKEFVPVLPESELKDSSGVCSTMECRSCWCAAVSRSLPLRKPARTSAARSRKENWTAPACSVRGTDPALRCRMVGCLTARRCIRCPAWRREWITARSRFAGRLRSRPPLSPSPEGETFKVGRLFAAGVTSSSRHRLWAARGARG